MSDENETSSFPTTPAFEAPKAEVDEEVIEFSEHGSFNYGMLTLWIAALFAVAAGTLFWFLNADTVEKISAKSNELSQIQSQIDSSTYANVDSEALALKSAVAAYSANLNKKYSSAEFMTGLYAHVNKNVMIRSVAITTEGKLTVDCQSDSYRSAADQILTLQSWKVNQISILDKVDLSSVTEKIESGKAVVTFTITASMNKNASLTSAGTD